MITDIPQVYVTNGDEQGWKGQRFLVVSQCLKELLSSKKALPTDWVAEGEDRKLSCFKPMGFDTKLPEGIKWNGTPERILAVEVFSETEKEPVYFWKR